MRLREVTIKNFRCLVDVCIPICDSTILIGENNCGKSAVLDAIRIALTAPSASRYKVFNEYDYHISKPGDGPETSPGIEITLTFRENVPGEWPEPLIRQLSEITQVQSPSGLYSIILRVKSSYNPVTKDLETSWSFLNFEGIELKLKRPNDVQLRQFLRYYKIFYLSGTRDFPTEFSSRSQFWTRMIRELKIEDNIWREIRDQLQTLNQEVLNSDPRLNQIVSAIDNIEEVLASQIGQKTSMQALPMRSWDLLRHTELVAKTKGNDCEFPLSLHGQGMQSLAVLFLYRAFVDVVLRPSYEKETEALLALEEPEAHLHPQGIVALIDVLREFEGQKIITSHSPYFLQGHSLTQIRVLRRHGSSTRLSYINKSFLAELNPKSELIAFASTYPNRYSYDSKTKQLSVSSPMEAAEYRKLLRMFSMDKPSQHILKILSMQSQSIINELELQKLGIYVQRIRGHILYARVWILCEGQCEFMLLDYIANVLNTPFCKRGISIIDFQNNGNPDSFVALANALRIPWFMMCDNDDSGKRYASTVKRRSKMLKDIGSRIRPIPKPHEELEDYLVRDCFFDEFIELSNLLNVSLEHRPGEPEFIHDLVKWAKNDKVNSLQGVLNILAKRGFDHTQVPVFLKEFVKDAVREAGLNGD